jgi:hypothetical protein
MTGTACKSREARLDIRSQLGSQIVREWLEQCERCRQMFAAIVLEAEGLFAAGEMDRSDGLLPVVAELLVHAGRLAVERGRVLGVASGQQDLTSAVERGGLAAVVSDLALQ